MDEKEKVIDEILRKIPRPNYSEMPSLYEELDRMGREMEEYSLTLISSSPKLF